MTRSLIPEDTILLVHAYLDGELDPTNALAIEQRIATDPTLAAECARVEALAAIDARAAAPRSATAGSAR